ncbi:DUF4181 domain-containing protein [Peribacillus loiseleuriae]|uniref:DUF4181 domain-containing protein n=1 Tax=Peribacillus loiseleuriae TaxID=1679170 RepID=UPI003CFD095C
MAFILGSVSEKILIKKFNIKKEKGCSYIRTNKMHKRGEWAILSFFLIALMYLIKLPRRLD